jgi:hypothetical protein
MRAAHTSILTLAVALTACGGAATESYVDGRWPASGRWVAIEWDGGPVPSSTTLGEITYVLDSARLIVGPGAHTLYVLDSHASDGYVGHDTLAGDFVLGGEDGQQLQLRFTTQPMATTAVVALRDTSMTLIWGIAGRGQESYVLRR